MEVDSVSGGECEISLMLYRWEKKKNTAFEYSRINKVGLNYCLFPQLRRKPVSCLETQVLTNQERRSAAT